MGNAGSNIPSRERHKSSDIMPPSPIKDGQAFVFEKKTDQRPGGDRPIFPVGGESHEEEEPYYTKTVAAQEDSEITSESRQRAYTQDDANKEEPDKKPALPTVFKWDGGGKQVFISGTFSDWRSLPMVRSHGERVICYLAFIFNYKEQN